MLLGRATRLQRFLLDLPKTYVATARLGWRSTHRRSRRRADRDRDRIPGELELPTGEVTQQVPMTSAVKVEGERLYKKAHRGEKIETPTRTVTVHRAELLEQRRRARQLRDRVLVGHLRPHPDRDARDAYCESLRRTAIGPHRVPDGEEQEIPVEELMSFLPERALDDDEAERGGPRTRGRGPGSATPTDTLRLTHDGRLIAIARAGW